jgi:hypothetical protein
MIGVLFYLDPGTLSQRHLDKAVYFDDIYHDLQLELSMADSARQDPGWFLQFVQRKIALAHKQPPVIPQRFWTQKIHEVANGHLAQELSKMAEYMEETFRAEAPTGIHENMAAAQQDVAVELGKGEHFGEEESQDYIDRMQLHSELQKEMRRIRNISKQKRYEYQVERFLNKSLPTAMPPPKVDEI